MARFSRAEDLPDSTKDKLSEREKQVVLLAAKGFANKVIARELNLAEGTVKIHLHNIYQKLGVSGRLALIMLTHPLLPAAGE